MKELFSWDLGSVFPGRPWDVWSSCGRLVGSEVGGSFHIQLSSLLVQTVCVSLLPRRSGSWPFSCWPCCLSPSPRGSVCFGSQAVFLSPGLFHARVFCAWWLASGSSGSRTSWEGMLACIQGSSDSLRHPSPGGETKTSDFGIAVRVLLWAASLSHCMVSSPATGRGLSISALKGCISAPLAFLF